MKKFDRHDLLNFNEINRKQIIRKKIEPGVLFDARNIQELPKFPQLPPMKIRNPKPQRKYEPGIVFDAKSVGNRPFRPKYDEPPKVPPKERIKDDFKANTPTYAEAIAKNIREREKLGKVVVLGDFNDQLREPNINESMFENDITVDIDSDDDDNDFKLGIGRMIIQGIINLGFGLDDKLL